MESTKEQKSVQSFKPPNMIHITCICSPEIALCGRRLGKPKHHAEGTSIDCVVCEDLNSNPCPRCGKE